MKVQRQTPPKAAPGFTLPDMDGATHALSDMRGKVVMLVVWDMVTGLPGGVASEAGADMSKNAPTVLIERVENGKTFYEKQTVTLEHKIRLNDNPFLAVSDTNLVKSLGYENSVLLEDTRRIEKATDVVWATDEIERLVRTTESTTP